MKLKYSHSYSKHQNYLKCPRLFRFATDPATKYMEVETDPLIIGEAAHEVFARYQLWCQERKDYLAGQILDITDKVAKEQRLTAEQKEALALHAEAFAKAKPFALDQEPLIEQKLAFTLTEGRTLQPANWRGNEANIRAVVDRCYFPADAMTEAGPTKVVITDWKTGRTREDDTAQLRCYAWLLSGVYPTLQEAEATFWYSIYRTADKPATFGRADMDAERDRFCSVIDKIESDTTFQPCPGHHCAWCSWAELCDVKDAAEPTDMPKLVAMACCIEAVLERMRDKIKAHLKVAGDIYVPEAKTVATMVPRDPTAIIKADDLATLLLGDAVTKLAEWAKVAPYFQVNHAALKHLYEDPFLAAELAKITTAKPNSPYFKVRAMTKAELECHPVPQQQLDEPEGQLHLPTSNAPTAEPPSPPTSTSTTGQTVQQSALVKQDFGGYQQRRFPEGGAPVRMVTQTASVMDDARYATEKGTEDACAYCSPSKEHFYAGHLESWWRPCPKCGGRAMPHTLAADGALLPIGPEELEAIKAGKPATAAEQQGTDTKDLASALKRRMKLRGIKTPGAEQAILMQFTGKLNRRGMTVDQYQNMLDFLANATDDQVQLALQNGRKAIMGKD
jgi:CRISPR/Cas system-associated exonuclease Cas4 (RecB family)